MRGPGFNPRHLHFFCIIIIIIFFSVGTTREHLGFCIALQVPTFVVVTKADLCSRQQMNRTVEQLELILSSAGCRKVAFKVKNESDACTAAQRFTEKQ